MTGPALPDRGSSDFDADVDVDGLLAFAGALVRCPTVNVADAEVVEAPAAALVAELMSSFGWEVTVTDVALGRPNVVGVIRGASPGRTLMFEGHSDVVTPGERSLWSFDPFAGDVVDGRLRGRGSADMKAGVAAMIYAARAVQLSGFEGRIVIGVLVDEEGMMLGAKHFARHGAPGVPADEIDGVIVCEPEAGEVCPVSKGAMRLQVEFTGRMAHGAMPEQGRNPLPAVGSLLVGIAELERHLAERVGAHPDLGVFSLTPTVLVAGEPAQLNVIPAVASVYLDVRTVPGIEHDRVLLLVRGLTDEICAGTDLTAAVVVIDDRPPVQTPADDPVVRAMLAGHRAATGRDAVLGGVPGTTDGTILTRDAGLPTVVYGPGGKWIAHQVDEFVEVDEIITCARAYAAAARHFLGAGAGAGAGSGAGSGVGAGAGGGAGAGADAGADPGPSGGAGAGADAGADPGPGGGPDAGAHEGAGT